MPDFSSVRIFWFSGTGNSFLAAQKAAECFILKGLPVTFIQITKETKPVIEANELIGLVFPVAVAGTYPFIWEFFEKLPAAPNMVFMLDTLGGYSGGIKGPLKKFLNSRGYKTIGAAEILMPENFPPGREISQSQLARIEPGLNMVEKFVEQVISGQAKWHDIPVWSDFLGIMCRFRAPWSFMRRIFSLRVNAGKCIKCGLCVKLCPVGNIEFNSRGTAEIKKQCQSCMRCIAFCPVAAITTRSGSIHNLRSCKPDELMVKEKSFFIEK